MYTCPSKKGIEGKMKTLIKILKYAIDVGKN